MHGGFEKLFDLLCAEGGGYVSEVYPPRSPGERGVLLYVCVDSVLVLVCSGLGLAVVVSVPLVGLSARLCAGPLGQHPSLTLESCL